MAEPLTSGRATLFRVDLVGPVRPSSTSPDHDVMRSASFHVASLWVEGAELAARQLFVRAAAQEGMVAGPETRVLGCTPLDGP
jgi:hypothetical protein